MNINLEKGPYLRELGDIPEDSVPVKFIWASNKIMKFEDEGKKVAEVEGAEDEAAEDE